MHLCCESTRFEHNVIVGRGANETCPRSAGANEMCPRSAGANETCSRKAGVRSARGSEEPEQHDARHLVEMSAGCASATLRARVFASGNFRSRIGIFRSVQSLLLRFLSMSPGRTVSSQDGQSQGSARQSCVLAASL